MAININDYLGVVVTATPRRESGSIRRTSSMEMSFPDGKDASVLIEGRARDIKTMSAGGAPKILAEDWLNTRVSPTKTIEQISSCPPLTDLEKLVGTSAVTGFRKKTDQLLDNDHYEQRPLALLLDDLVGSSIIATWVWTKWFGDPEELVAWVSKGRPSENACVGYTPGASGLISHKYLEKIDYVPPLGREDDPYAFHTLQADQIQTMRRVRRIDLWRDDDGILIDCMFQDSGVLPGNRRSAVHEYRVLARTDATAKTLIDIRALPGILPHPECHGAPGGVDKLVGLPLADLRSEVLLRLRGEAGCTHLNDAARALAEIPFLAAHLD